MSPVRYEDLTADAAAKLRIGDYVLYRGERCDVVRVSSRVRRSPVFSDDYSVRDSGEAQQRITTLTLRNSWLLRFKMTIRGEKVRIREPGA